MIPSLWPDWLEGILWAKSAEKSAGGQAESLATHTWYVLERLAEAVSLLPDLPKRLISHGFGLAYFGPASSMTLEKLLEDPRKIARRAEMASPP